MNWTAILYDKKNLKYTKVLFVQITESHDRPLTHWVFTSTMTIQQAENHVSEYIWIMLLSNFSKLDGMACHGSNSEDYVTQ